MIAFSHVSVRYRGSRIRALDDVSIVAPVGTLTAVVGPNGSGKSTLVRALVGQVTLEQGTIVVDDQLVRDDARGAIARRVAVVTQREEPAFPLGVRPDPHRHPVTPQRQRLTRADRSAAPNE